MLVRQVLLAGARAHTMIRRFGADVAADTPAALQRLVAWKETLSTDSEQRDSDCSSSGLTQTCGQPC